MPTANPADDHHHDPYSDPLAAYLDAAVEAATDSQTRTLLLQTLAATEGGHLPLELLTSAVVPQLRGLEAERGERGVRHAVACLLEQPEDKRKNPPLELQHVGGEAFVVLTATGWKMLGKPNKRSGQPDIARAGHSIAVHNIARWLRAEHLPRLAQLGVEGRVDGTRVVGTDYVARRDTLLRVSARSTPDADVLAGGLYPDLVLKTSWPDEHAATRAEIWPDAPANRPDVAVAVEVELTAKNTIDISHKLARHAAAIAAGWHDAVLWIVRDAATWTLIDRAARAGGHADLVRYVVPTWRCGHGRSQGEPHTTYIPSRWPEAAWAWGEIEELGGSG